ncbi:immunoglobulin superfamily member 6 isoform X2 [Esox lucius]|nr:immunoglobulin superfamily member 6 isoform X2 [Esox lucius]
MGNCKLLVYQPDEVMWQVSDQSGSLPCTITTNSTKPIEIRWFVFSEHSYHLVDLDTYSYKYRLEKQALNINSLQANDSGIYHCAAFLSDMACSGAQTIGQGTTVLVKERGMEITGYVLWLLFVLLALYSVAVLILLICKKTGRDATFWEGTRWRRDKKNTTQKIRFGAVVQELYVKRKLRSNKNSEVIDPTQNKVESPHSNLPHEDIYQNL